jgi:O-methyltransferase
MYALYKAVEYLEKAGISGAIVECGVWRGGSMMVAALASQHFGGRDREFYLFDTFEGLPRPSDLDLDVWGNPALDWWLPTSTGAESSHAAEAALDEVRANLLSTGYPGDRLHFIKGMVERTLPAAAPPAIALLRLDTDWYASTKYELEHLFPRIVKNGVLIIDDYGHFLGARRAVDEYIAQGRLPLLLNRIDYTGRLAVKTG